MMLRFSKSTVRWWQKPLVALEEGDLPAELAVLRAELQPGEKGVWLNSRGVQSGVTGLRSDGSGSFKTVRQALPEFCRNHLRVLYEQVELKEGAPDLMIWNVKTESVRFVEVKCPHWDRPSAGQVAFHQAAAAREIPTTIREWEFRDASQAAV